MERAEMVMRVSLVCGDYSLDIPANAYSMWAHAERLNHVSADSMTGERFSVDLGPTRVSSVISWRCVHYTIAKLYEDFLLKKIRMGLNPFTIITPAHDDFGYGKGIAIPNAYYNGPANTRQIIQPNGSSGMYYDIELPYMFIREA
jgi:hypothetical protein